MTLAGPHAKGISIYLQAEALRRAFPGWSIAVQARPGDRLRIEAVSQGAGELYAVISSDPAEIWAELSTVTGRDQC